jgi:hypothetical protein
MTGEVEATTAEASSAYESEDSILLDECPEFARLAVTTQYSRYELVVLNGASGDVLVRGGRSFPSFRRARFAGSSAGRAALALNRIEVGLKMELVVGGRCFVTSTVQAASRTDALTSACGARLDRSAEPRTGLHL